MLVEVLFGSGGADGGVEDDDVDGIVDDVVDDNIAALLLPTSTTTAALGRCRIISNNSNVFSFSQYQGRP